MSNFVHLHIHSEYSLLDGANRIKDLPIRAKELGMDAIALTDHGSMFGTIDFYKACKANGIKPIIGCEVYVAPRSRKDKDPNLDARYNHLILLAKNNDGYKNLAKLVSLGYTEGFYYKPRIDKETLEQYHENLICCSACLAGEVNQAILKNNMEEAKKVALWFKKLFGEDYYLEIQNNGIKEQVLVNQKLIELSRELDIPLVATNDAHYLKREDAYNHEVLLCIQTGKKMSDEDRMKFETDELYVKSPEEMSDYFKNVPEAIENTVKIAEKCNVEFEFGHTILPNYDVPEEFETHYDYLKKLCDDGIKNRYGENPTKEILERAEFEMNVINQMGYVDYFLIVWDYIHYAKTHNIPVGPGRGSGAGSIVAYAIEITDIDPIKYGLIFERFLNPERISMPDFDVDFCYEKRDQVIDYVCRKYGHDHVSQIITFGTMSARMVIRDVGRVLDVPYAETDKIAKMVPNELHITIKKAMEQNRELRDLYEQNSDMKKMLDIAMALEGMPRQASTHACGIVITKDPVVDYVPLYRRDDIISTQYIMTTLEELGLLKMDFLGLRTLTVIQDTIELVKANRGIDVEFDKDMNDSKVYKLWQDGNSVGIFQFESQGMTNFMKELKPDCLEDIIAGVSLYRPGPMDQIPRYIANKKDPEHAVYTHPALKPILEVTYGCMVYQEQVMQIVRDLAGYSLGRADLVRRAMGKKKLDVMAKERENFIHGQVDENGNIIIKGCVRNGIDEKSANKIFDEMAEFAKYAFNKSHAACYAVVAYRTAYLKAYYPVEFMAAMLNSFLGNLDKIPAYTEECKRLNIQILKPDINKSYTKFTVDGDKIRFGLGSVKNVGTSAVDEIVAERDRNGQFKDFTDFCERIQETNVNKKCIESLIKAGAFDEFNETRRTLMESFESILDTITSSNKKELEGQVNMFDLGGSDSKEMKYTFKEFPEYSRKELLFMEKEMLGLYISGHPLDNIRHQIEMQTNINSFQMRQMENTDEIGDEIRQEIKDGQMVKYAGIITKIKKKYTKNNKLMAFLTVEDLYGPTEIILFESAYQNCANVLMEDNIVLVNGRLSVREDEETKIVANQITEFATKKKSIFILDVTSLDEKTKVKLKGAIKFFTGDRNNMPLEIINNTVKSMAGGIYITPEILKEFQELIGTENAKVEEVE
ncbi:dNA polymerase III alpha subunit [Clostridium sp. CAG:273]|jgi:DNA polymerase-3 subunit alpha|nr:DNA polymerase III subunit alpha [Clostridia bacterium]CDE83997.1 dNA polymerase III alpha subunit [Clostridium sp. CAG:273]